MFILKAPDGEMKKPAGRIVAAGFSCLHYSGGVKGLGGLWRGAVLQKNGK